MAKDRQWLKQRLCSALGWDEVVVDGVVEAIASAETPQEVDAIVQVRKTCVLIHISRRPTRMLSSLNVIALGSSITCQDIYCILSFLIPILLSMASGLHGWRRSG